MGTVKHESLSVREYTRRFNQRQRDMERRRDRNAKLSLHAAWLRDALVDHVSWLPNERESVNA